MRAIDCFVNVGMGSAERPAYLVRVAEDYFKRTEHIFKDISQSEMLETMDRIGVSESRSSRCAPRRLRARHHRLLRKAHPGAVRPSPPTSTRGAACFRAAQRYTRAVHKNHPVVLARAVPFMINLPPDDRVYYPLYAKCIEEPTCRSR